MRDRRAALAARAGKRRRISLKLHTIKVEPLPAELTRGGQRNALRGATRMGVVVFRTP
jgi:hypothetical protein